MNTNQKTAILISLEDSTSEIVQLANTLGYTILKEFIQHRTNPDVNYYIGCGKVNEIKEFLEDAEESVDLIIVNGELKPSQWFSQTTNKKNQRRPPKNQAKQRTPKTNQIEKRILLSLSSRVH
jgi:50S ribosomal subunit-associated GTPase HflX